MPVKLFPLGSQGMMVPRIGCGIMSAAFYGSGSPAADELAQLEALDALVEYCAPHPAFIDTAWVYSHPTGLHSEEIVGKAVAKHGRAAFVIATKFGNVLFQAPCSSRDVIHAQYADSVRRLGCTPDLYYQHRPDPARAIEDVMADLKAMLSEGKFKYIGLSECTAEELRRAHAVHPVSAIQMEWSLIERGIETALLPTCAELGVGIVPYSPLGRGLLTGAVAGAASLDASDRRHRLPRWEAAALDSNLAKTAALARCAARKGCTPSQLALAWLLAKGDNVFPIPGSKTAARVRENMAAAEIVLTAGEVAEIEALDLAVLGQRFPPAGLAHTWEARTPGANDAAAAAAAAVAAS